MPASDLPLGEFELVVLLAILRLHDDAYGLSIRREIAACTDRAPSPGAVYTTLDRLQEKGLTASKYQNAGQGRGGRQKRLFRVTAKGLAAVGRAQRSSQRLFHGLVLPGGAHA